MERVVLDTNLFINLMIETELTEKAKFLLKKVVTNYKPIILSNIFEETIFILIREELKVRGNISRFHEVIDYIEKRDYKDMKLYKEFINLLNDLNIEFLTNRFDVSDFKDILEGYRLLPNDALIAATCRFYGIRRIATFDDDFKRVKFLKVVEV